METTNFDTEKAILIHNIAGELASRYVSELAKKAMGGSLSHTYFLGNWKGEYNSRVKQMTEHPELVDFLNGFNEYYQCSINQTSQIRRKFYYEGFK